MRLYDSRSLLPVLVIHLRFRWLRWANRPNAGHAEHGNASGANIRSIVVCVVPPVRRRNDGDALTRTRNVSEFHAHSKSRRSRHATPPIRREKSRSGRYTNAASACMILNSGHPSLARRTKNTAFSRAFLLKKAKTAADAANIFNRHRKTTSHIQD